jgi:hypothetical protein
MVVNTMSTSTITQPFITTRILKPIINNRVGPFIVSNTVLNLMINNIEQVASYFYSVIDLDFINKIGKYENRNDSFIEISKNNNKRDIGEKNIYEERIKKLEELDKKKDVEITLLKGAIEHMKAEIEKLKDLTNIFNLFYNYICIYD